MCPLPFLLSLKSRFSDFVSFLSIAFLFFGPLILLSALIIATSQVILRAVYHIATKSMGYRSMIVHLKCQADLNVSPKNNQIKSSSCPWSLCGKEQQVQKITDILRALERELRAWLDTFNFAGFWCHL